MNTDYLWDKTGEDLEIEQLENALQTFRYQETAPPMLPFQLKKVEIISPTSFFAWFPMRVGFAMATCLLVGAVFAFAVWFQLSDTTPNLVVVANVTPEKVISLPEETKKINLPENNPKFVETKFTATKQTVKNQFVKVQKSSPLILRANKTAAQKVDKVKPTDRLTKEELYAYTQLMTALSITSAKLKAVKDKVEGVEN